MNTSVLSAMMFIDHSECTRTISIATWKSKMFKFAVAFLAARQDASFKLAIQVALRL